MNKSGMMLGLVLTLIVGVGIWSFISDRGGVVFMDLPPEPLIKIRGGESGVLAIPESAGTVLTITYAPELAPDSLRVLLDGRDVSHLFSPEAGSETVSLPFKKYSSYKLSVEALPRQEAMLGLEDDGNASAYHQLHRWQVRYELPQIEVMPAQQSKILMRKLTDPPPSAPLSSYSYNPSLKRPWEE